jgi:hypothetical protein
MRFRLQRSNLDPRFCFDYLLEIHIKSTNVRKTSSPTNRRTGHEIQTVDVEDSEGLTKLP